MQAFMQWVEVVAMTNNAKEFFTRAVSVPVGFLLSLIGVILPWRARNAYLNLVGLVVDKILQSNAIVGYFMEVGFSTERFRRHGEQSRS